MRSFAIVSGKELTIDSHCIDQSVGFRNLKKDLTIDGGTVAEWSKAVLEREKINENQKIPGSPPAWHLKKKELTIDHASL